MAYLKLSYNEKLDVPKAVAEKVKLAIESKQDGDTPIEVSKTRTIRLRQVKDVDVEGSSEGADCTKSGKYDDLEKHREAILKFANLVSAHGGFEGYCLDNQLIFPSNGGCGMAVNSEKHGQYTDAIELWTAYAKLKDIIRPETQEEKIAKLDEMRLRLQEKFGMFKVKTV